MNEALPLLEQIRKMLAQPKKRAREYSAEGDKKGKLSCLPRGGEGEDLREEEEDGKEVRLGEELDISEGVWVKEVRWHGEKQGKGWRHPSDGS